MCMYTVVAIEINFQFICFLPVVLLGRNCVMIPLVSWVTHGKLHLVHNQPPALMSNCLHLLLQSLELNEDTEFTTCSSASGSLY